MNPRARNPSRLCAARTIDIKKAPLALILAWRRLTPAEAGQPGLHRHFRPPASCSNDGVFAYKTHSMALMILLKRMITTTRVSSTTGRSNVSSALLPFFSDIASAN